MQRLHDIGNALIVALLSIGLMAGALSISLVESIPEATPTFTAYPLPSSAPLTYTSTSAHVFTPLSGLQTPTLTLVTPTSTDIVMPGSCQPPSDWGYIVIQGGETLDVIAARYRINKNQLRVFNCLLSDNLVAGTVLYVPTAATSTPVVCRQGAAGWVKTYVVKPGDTLYAIANNHYISAELLKDVNCRFGNLIYSGEVLWVPYVATRTPYPIPISVIIVTPYPTDPLTETALPFTATIVPSNTPTPATTTAVSTSMPAP